MDGEVAIQPEGYEQPFVYRGFRMVDEDKLRELRGDELRKMNQNGMLPLIYAHLFSLSQMRDVFARQMQQGKAPAPGPAAAPTRRPSYSAAVANCWPSRASPRPDGEGFDERGGPVEAGSGRLQALVEIAAAIELDLQRVDAPRRSGVALDHVAAGKRVVETGLEARAAGDRHALRR